MVAPFVFLAALSSSGSMPFLVMLGMYGLYLLRAGSYGWADQIFYGEELDGKTRDIRPQFPDKKESRVRFPGTLARGLLRLVAAAILGGACALVAASFSHPHQGGGLQDTLELASRIKAVYIPLAEPDNHWALEVKKRTHSAIAYSSLEAVPPGPVEQISLHDALERAIAAEQIDQFIIDPGAEQLLIERSDFAYYKLHLPPWQTPDKVLKR